MPLNEIVLEKLKNRSAPMRPYLQKKFWARKHPAWGASVCWYTWSPFYGWQVCWGIACETLHEAKILRKFLNGKVDPFAPSNMPFYKVVQFVQSTRLSETIPKEFY